MTLEEIKNLKDKIYELEGLLELAQLREDKIEELTPLILSRLSLLQPEAAPIPKSQPEPAAAPTPDPAPVIAVERPERSEALPHGIAVGQCERSEALTRPERSEREKPAAPIFCLNDRFRFRKTLFGGSEAEFADAMKTIAEMDSYEEAEQYFLDSYNWDPEDPEVIDFLDILSIYYDSPRL